MKVNVLSAWRRRTQKLGVGLLWTLIFGVLLGGIVFFRPVADETFEQAVWHDKLRRGFELLERWTFDWRMRSLGAVSEPSDEVISVSLDDETLASARAGSYFQAAMQPWARELTGAFVGQILREKASLVIVDFPLTDISPHQCGAGVLRPLDDERLHRQLESFGKNVMLTASWRGAPQSLSIQALHPYLLLVGTFDSIEHAHEPIRRVLSEHVPAFVSTQRNGLKVWAASTSEAEAQSIAGKLGLPQPWDIHERVSADQDQEMTVEDLIASLSKVEVVGLDSAKLPLAQTLEGPNPVAFSSNNAWGANTLTPDADGTLRSIQHLVKYRLSSGESVLLPSVALSVAMQKTGTRSLRFQQGRLFIGDRFSIPMDESGRSSIRWTSNEIYNPSKGTLKRFISAWRFLANMEDSKRDDDMLRHDNRVEGKVIVFSDATSRSGKTLTASLGRVSSGAIWSQAIQNILRSDGVQRVTPLVDFFITLLMAALGALWANLISTLFRFKSSMWRYGFPLVLVIAIYVVLVRYLFIHSLLWVGLVVPVLAFCGSFLGASGYAAKLERRVRDFVQTALGTYLPTEVAQKLERDVRLLEPERKILTVGFVDIIDFHVISQKLEPALLGQFLEEYFSCVTEVVLETQGQVDKFLGDGVVAFWGAPIRLKTHAAAACGALLHIHASLQSKREAWQLRYGVTVEIRSALQTGELVVGEMGTRHKMNYSALGAPVSQVFRMESLASRMGASILVGRETAAQSGEGFVFRQLGRIRWRQGDEFEPVFELLGKREDVPSSVLDDSQAFSEAYRLYLARDFETAGKLFKQLGAGGDIVSEKFASRCEQYARHPPEVGWDAVDD